MQSEEEKRKLWYFITTLAILALVINGVVANLVRRGSGPEPADASQPSSQYQRQSSPQPSQTGSYQDRQRTEEADRLARAAADRARAAEEHANYLARYVGARATRQFGTASIALVTATENRHSNRALGDALAQRLGSKSVTFLPTFFNPEFVSDGLFNEAFNEPCDLPRKLELANSLDGLLVARQSVGYTTNEGLQGVITATMRLDLLALPISENAQRQAWTFTSYGAGFNPTDARNLAEERLIKQIATDTKMSLAVFH